MIIAFVLVGLSSSVKAYVTFLIVTSVIYLALTIWNWQVFRTNAHMFEVKQHVIPNYSNEFFIIPVHTQIIDHRILAIENAVGRWIRHLIEEEHATTSIDIMVYTKNYRKKTRFSVESVIHFSHCFDCCYITRIINIKLKALPSNRLRNWHCFSFVHLFIHI